MAETLLNSGVVERLLEYSKEILLVYDLDQKAITYISPSVSHVLGYSAGELMQKSFEKIVTGVHEDDLKELEAYITNLGQQTENNKPFTLNFRYRNKSGSFNHLELKGIIDTEQGEARSVFCLIQDLTHLYEADISLKEKNDELKRAKEALDKTHQELSVLNKKLEKHNQELEQTYDRLSSSEEVFRQLAENTNDIFWMRDQNEIIYINNQFEKIWGRKKEELIEDPYKISSWIHPEDKASVEPWVNIASLSSDEPYTEQYRIVKPDGEIRWLWSRIFPVKDKNGRKYRLVGILSDITEQKEYEEALMIAKEKAQESDMLKSTFLANISHEIRTPMNGIIGFAELISRDDIDVDTRSSYVAIMKKSSDQLVRIIDDIIDFAKLEANQIRVEKESVDLNKTLDQLFIQFTNQLKAQEKNAVTLLLKKSLPDTECAIISDEQRLRQVFMHLLDNACKYTAEGFIEFGYTLSDEKVEFFVKDSGIGIPEDKHQLIFEQFRQVDEGHTRKFGGTGLGLPIASGLVNLLGGSMKLESQRDKGSTFYFTVPYTAEYLKAEPSSITTPLAKKYNWKDKLILVAEDDELNFEYIKIILEPTQAKVIRAKDGSQAVKICANLHFDLILMDIRLPVLNGMQATRRLREMGINTPIIAQTAFAMDDDEKKCLDAGCNQYLAKPISKEKLFQVMDALL